MNSYIDDLLRKTRRNFSELKIPLIEHFGATKDFYRVQWRDLKLKHEESLQEFAGKL